MYSRFESEAVGENMRWLENMRRLHAAVLLIARTTTCFLPQQGPAPGLGFHRLRLPGRGASAFLIIRLRGGGGVAIGCQQMSSTSGSSWCPGLPAPLALPTSAAFDKVDQLSIANGCSRGFHTNSDNESYLALNSEQPSGTAEEEIEGDGEEAGRSTAVAKGGTGSGHGCADHVHTLQFDIEEFVNKITLTKKLSRLQQHELSNLQDIAKDVFGPAARLIPFGSVAAGLGTIHSDVDVALSLGNSWDAEMFARGAVGAARLLTPGMAQRNELPSARGRSRASARKRTRTWAQNDPVRGERIRILRKLARAVETRARNLSQHCDIELVLRAKVPVMKLTMSSGVEIDCSVHTRVHSGSITCDVLRTLASSDERVRLLAMVRSLALRPFCLSSFCGCPNMVCLTLVVCVFASPSLPLGFFVCKSGDCWQGGENMGTSQRREGRLRGYLELNGAYIAIAAFPSKATRHPRPVCPPAHQAGAGSGWEQELSSASGGEGAFRAFCKWWRG